MKYQALIVFCIMDYEDAEIWMQIHEKRFEK